MEQETIWMDTPNGLFARFLNNIGLSSTVYQVVGDELILKEGFIRRNTTVIKLSNLKDPKLIEGLYQRFIKVGTIYLKTVDTNKTIILKNLKEPEKARKLFVDLLKDNNKDYSNE